MAHNKASSKVDKIAKNILNDGISFKSSDPITSFIYELIRDYVPAGVVEKVIKNIENEGCQEITYEDQYVSRYAEELANRLASVKPPDLIYHKSVESVELESIESSEFE